MNLFVDDYVVFDIETTGLDYAQDRIIEIGALKYRNNTLVEEFNVLIHPGCVLPEIITKITGITDEDLQGKPSIAIALPQFLAFIENLPLIAHNNSFDLSFIREEMKRENLPILRNETIDTLFLSRVYIREAYNHKLETLKHYFKIEQISHRAIGDCYTTNYVYQECKKRAMVRN